MIDFQKEVGKWQVINNLCEKCNLSQNSCNACLFLWAHCVEFNLLKCWLAS